MSIRSENLLGFNPNAEEQLDRARQQVIMLQTQLIDARKEIAELRAKLGASVSSVETLSSSRDVCDAVCPHGHPEEQ